MTGESSRHRRAYLCGLGAVLIWSTVATAFKIALRHLDYLQLLLVADLVSVCTLALILAIQGRLRLLRSLSRRELLHCGLLGALNPFLYYLVLFKAYSLLPAQVAQPLNYTWAITLSLLSVPLLGQRLARRDLLAICVGYAGVVVLSTQGNLTSLDFGSPLGVGLALGSTLIWALYWIGSAKSATDPVLALLLNFACALPMVLAATLLFSAMPPPVWEGLLAAAYVGVFEMGVSFVLWLYAMRQTRNVARMGNLIFLSPFLSLLLIHAVLGESIQAATFAGLALILCGNLLQKRGA
ncbi:MAG: DMT family transporter [Proteobacteria bacterium]|nr:DMT family transporter [Pseudomonadota bacterium]MBU1594543.1 DMT family transporter [Pseudomonadota bacterium]